MLQDSAQFSNFTVMLYVPCKIPLKFPAISKNIFKRVLFYKIVLEN